ncbi:MAG TPA: ferrous iron transport protein B [Candidatus Paceibacterota bacterium]|nr:ferrous iron transport protein B [Candidatus Paceibacterota bacterium]
MNSAAAQGGQPTKKISGPAYVVLTGNPNCGKTTLFNALTGLRAKVGNYAGVTVERKEGKLLDAPPQADIRILDLPGTYSLSPQSLDEQVSRDVLLNRLPELPAPDAIIIVIDASNLQRNLYYATQVIELGYPTIVALNMIDVAENNGHSISSGQLSQALGVPVLPIIASSGEGIAELKQEIFSQLTAGQLQRANDLRFCDLPEAFSNEVADLATLLAATFDERRAQARAEALLILSNEKALASSLEHYPQPVQDAVNAARQRLEAANVDWRGAAIEGRYNSVSAIQQAVTTELAPPGETFSDKLDRVLTHKLWGTLIFVAIMALMFQSIFTFAKVPMELLQHGVDWIGGLVGKAIPPGDLNSLLVDGVVAGVGAVVVFLPQILLLFLFIGFLEDTGYMARAAFLMDRLMSKVGLHGKSFIPMLSSFACAIPGIMATRTIESPKDRLVTILVAPLMSCSARLPVYTLLIGACIPKRVLGNLRCDVNLGFVKFNLFGFLGLQGLTMLSMYLLGIVVALIMAWVFKKTLLKGETPMLIMELPPYKRPLLRVIARHMWDRSKIFLRRAGTVILGINIILWFLATYPKSPAISQEFAAKQTAVEQSASDEKAKAEALAEINREESGTKLRNSFAGRLGRAIEPLIKPLGFDWKIGIGIVSSFAAREVFVSTMSTVYNVGEEGDGTKTQLEETLRQQKRPDGTPVFTTLTAVTLMVFYVFALQCVSTVAIVRRETNSWKWPLFQWAYMGILAWGFAFATLHLGRLLGWG